MLVFSAISFVLTSAFIRNILSRMVHTDKANTDWIASALLELLNLTNKIPNHAVDLLYHRLGENLGLGADLDRRYRPARNKDASFDNGYRRRNNFAERTVTSSCRLSDSDIPQIYHSLVAVNSFDESS